MLSSSFLGALLFLLVTSHVSTKENRTASSHQNTKNKTKEKRQNIGKCLLTREHLELSQYCITILSCVTCYLCKDNSVKPYVLINKIFLLLFYGKTKK